MDVRERLAVAALAVVLAVTASWWALALWPLAGEAPEWLVRTRAVCFGAAPDGLPDAAGWLALIGQPVLMLGTLRVVAGNALGDGLRKLGDRGAGRAVLGAAGALLLTGVGLVGWRIAEVRAAGGAYAGAHAPAEWHPWLGHAAAELGLVDQHGQLLTLDRLRGRPALVTFAYAHCATVCPVIVRDVLDARALLGEVEVAAVVVTLDPWRDTPARLPAISARWGLDEDAYVLTGTVAELDAVLEAWRVPWSRDPRTGEITHPVLVYVLDAEARVAFASAAGAETLAALVRRLENGTGS